MKWLRQNHPLITSFFILCVLGGITVLNQNPTKYSGSQKGSAHSYQTIDDRDPYISSRYQVLSQEPVTNPNPKRDEWRSERDLIAQTEMAKWAFWVFIISGFMMLFSAIGVTLVLFTLKETSRGVDEQSRIFRLGNQPILVTKSIRFIPYFEVDTVDGWLQTFVSFYYEWEVENIGKTPAKALCLDIQAKLIVGSGSNDGPKHSGWVAAGIVLPNAIEKFGIQLGGRYPAVDFFEGDGTLMIDGKIRFSDIFRDEVLHSGKFRQLDYRGWWPSARSANGRNGLISSNRVSTNDYVDRKI